MHDDMITVGKFPERRLVGRVSRLERIGAPPYGRISVEVDALDAKVSLGALDEVLDDARVVSPFAAIRLVTTSSLLERDFGFIPTEGDWVELFIRPRAGLPGPIAFHAQLSEEGYLEHTRGVLDDARLIFRDEEEPPRELSASVPASTALAAALKNACVFSSKAVVSKARVTNLLCRLAKVDRILVRDVGQASFVSLIGKSGKCLAHFDAGWPISFNRKTSPKNSPALSGKAPVILSHWDWDHLHAYYKCSSLRAVKWLVPVQQLGPGAQKIARQLQASRLLLGYRGPSINTGALKLLCCSGPSRMNDNGFALDIVLRSGKRALLVGDSRYDATGCTLATVRYDYLVVTHHGAEFDGAVPLPNGRRSRAVISVGRGNVYKHPRTAALNRHIGWRLERTSAYGGQRRADRFLG